MEPPPESGSGGGLAKAPARNLAARCPFWGGIAGSPKSSTGYPVLGFRGPPPGVEKRMRACKSNRGISSGSPAPVSCPRRRFQKSSTGYPVLDFWNRRRGHETGAGEPLDMPRLDLQARMRFSTPGGGPRKPSTGYPVLDFGLPAIPPQKGQRAARFLAGAFASPPPLPDSGGGSKSQAPDIRCLTLASPLSAPISRKKPPGLPAAVPKGKLRISGCLTFGRGRVFPGGIGSKPRRMPRSPGLFWTPRAVSKENRVVCRVSAPPPPSESWPRDRCHRERVCEISKRHF